MRKTRRVVQFGFLVLTVVGVFVVRGNAELWCPFGGVEALYTYTQEGSLICSLGISNFYILAAVLVIALLIRRAFCGYACPIGTISEWVQRGAARLGIQEVRVPYRLDRALALLKYGVLAFILFITYRSGELLFREFDPCYALISRHGEDITVLAYIVAGAILVASLFLVMPFCRWLCPLAAALHPLSRFGLTRIRRHEDACTTCGACTAACPMAIPVDQVRQVTAARCLSCLNCVEACPAGSGGAVSWGPPRWAGRRWPQSVLIAVLLVCMAGAVVAAYAVPIASFVNVRGDRPTETAAVELNVGGLTCRGRATLFMYYLERDDDFAIPGYMRVEAWPGQGEGKVRITYDPAATDELAVKQAITEPYYDPVGRQWRPSPFAVAGYDPLGAPEP